MTKTSRAIAGISITLTSIILIWILKKPALRYVFHHNENVATPDDWKPRMRTWKNGIEQ